MVIVMTFVFVFTFTAAEEPGNNIIENNIFLTKNYESSVDYNKYSESFILPAIVREYNNSVKYWLFNF